MVNNYRNNYGKGRDYHFHVFTLKKKLKLKLNNLRVFKNVSFQRYINIKEDLKLTIPAAKYVILLI